MKEYNKYFNLSFITGLFNSGFSSFISLLLIPIIINKIGINNYGAWAYIFLFTGFSGITDLGISKALIKYLANDNLSVETRNKYLSSAIYLLLIILLFLVSLLLIVSFFNISLFKEIDSLPIQFKHHLLIIGLLIIIINVITNFFRGILEANIKIHYINLGYSLLTLTIYSSILITSFLTINLSYFILSTLLSYFLILLYNLFLAIPYLKTYRIVSAPVKLILKDSFYFFGISSINSLLLPINRYLLTVFTGNPSLHGVFDIAVKVGMMFNSIFVSYSTPFYSIYSKLGNNNISQINKKLKFVLRSSLLFYIFSLLLFLLIGNKVLTSLFKFNSNLELFYPVLIMLISFGINGMSESYNRILWVSDKLGLIMKLKLIIPALNIASYILFYNYLNIVTISISYSVPFLIYSVIIIRYYYINYLPYAQKQNNK